MWSASGVEPRACQTLQWIADASASREPVWRGSGLLTEQQGIKVLGTPLCHADFVVAHLDRVLSDHRTLLQRIPAARRPVRVGTALLHSAASRANCQVRVVRQAVTEGSARGHDEGLWRFMCEILRVPSDAGLLARDTASLALGGLGLRSCPALPHGRSLRGGLECPGARFVDALNLDIFHPQKKRSAPSATCSAFRNASLAAAMVASCCESRGHFGSSHFSSSHHLLQRTVWCLFCFLLNVV